jgi:hypothetical protein
MTREKSARENRGSYSTSSLIDANECSVTHNAGFRIKYGFLSIEDRDRVYDLLSSSKIMMPRGDVVTDLHITDYAHCNEFKGDEFKLLNGVVNAMRIEAIRSIPSGSELDKCMVGHLTITRTVK